MTTPHENHKAKIAAAVALAQATLTKAYVPPECTEESHTLAYPPAHWLDDREAWTASAEGYDDLKPGERVTMKAAERALIGRAKCGHLYLLTPESVSADLAKRAPAAVEADLRKTV